MANTQVVPDGSRICQIIGCSDGLAESRRGRIALLDEYVRGLGYEVCVDDRLFVPDGEVAASALARVDMLVRAISDPRVSLILDVTGGDATSAILRHLPPRIAGGENTRYFGISDNTTVHVMLARVAPAVTRVYWYPTNLVLNGSDAARSRFETLLETDEQPPIDLAWLRGEAMSGPIIGGNIRCLLKLAGTRYFPNLTGVVLFLESGSGGLARIEASLDQMHDMGAFEGIAGVILGDFGGFNDGDMTKLETYLACLLDQSIAICTTTAIGHGTNTIPMILDRDFSVQRPPRT